MGEGADADGHVRGWAEAGRQRPLATRFGEVRVTRIAYRARGGADLHPADAVLNLPVEEHSHGLRRLAAAEADRGSFHDAAAAIERATTVRIGKRQVERWRWRRRWMWMPSTPRTPRTGRPRTRCWILPHFRRQG